MEKPLYAPESISPLKVLELFKSNESHIAFVIDEYGGVGGLVTLHDVVQEIVGDIPEASEQENPRITKRDDGSFLVEGMIAVDEFHGHFCFDISRDGGYNTLAGYIMEILGRIPKTREILKSDRYSFEIVDMEGVRIDKIIV
jgi:putative hemolysin